MSARRKRWELAPPASSEFTRATGLSPLLATLLYQRQQHTPETIAAFLTDDHRTGLHDPFLMKGMAEGCDRILHAIQHEEKIAIYGDFDTDGVTAVTLLIQALTAMGAQVQPYIPHRTREGYGLNVFAINELASRGVQLLITVDCGISNVVEVAEAKRLGLDVIITDHHQPHAILPDALVVINPKQAGCSYPYKDLVGVGIAYKLVQALVRRGLTLNGLRGRDLLDVVALGTVADMGPLHGENRTLVKMGLKAIHSSERPGLKALIELAGLRRSAVTATDIGFALGPRLNAAGRLDDAVRSYELLLAQDAPTAVTLAQALNQANRERQDLTKRVQTEAQALAEATGLAQRRLVLLAHEEFPAGVLGLVAARLVEEWARPVLLIERGEGESRGSARSVPGFSIIDALTQCQDLFVRFGGHAAAAGFTIHTLRLPELEARLLAIAEQHLTDEMLVPRLLIDAEVELNRLDWGLLEELKRLEPFGQANPIPVLMSSRVEVVDVRTRGVGGQHLRLVVRKNGTTYEAIAFRMGHLADAVRRHPLLDLAYTFEDDEWNNDRRLQLKIKDFRRATQG
ncbi:single-stranded-DNA-specific exonuclease RecJ [Candidatus Chloroploca sp. M-50]|uniref:Single-stranded-DNA-specific exonuclease RecJ n=1 Tax=Candidatus Chloroploca mongolica TaxID=2528176 RepID=A0ABS4D3V0_9CHLR|nr:single-stranded-DNA-specific exonuclease RecJ [Candidatus Chloroploca mongolica]MBP1464100.1 single-stranded-DNA-specific exonuclease RecJ [Candidatus Chloroploca mongolica]